MTIIDVDSRDDVTPGRWYKARCGDLYVISVTWSDADYDHLVRTRSRTGYEDTWRLDRLMQFQFVQTEARP